MKTNSVQLPQKVVDSFYGQLIDRGLQNIADVVKAFTDTSVTKCIAELQVMMESCEVVGEIIKEITSAALEYEKAELEYAEKQDAAMLQSINALIDKLDKEDPLAESYIALIKKFERSRKMRSTGRHVRHGLKKTAKAGVVLAVSGLAAGTMIACKGKYAASIIKAVGKYII